MAVEIIREVGRPSLVGKALENWLVDVASWMENWQRGSGHYTQRADSSVNSYKVVISKNEDRAVIEADPAVEWALFGRKSSEKFPPWNPEEGFYTIKQWIKDKPVIIDADEDIDSVAYLIARKIKEKGSSKPKLVPQNISIVMENFAHQHLDTLGEELAKQTADDLMKAFKRKKR